MDQELREALTLLLEKCLLRIRGEAGKGDTESCRVEADHLHNIPRVLLDYQPGLLPYYWDAERLGYLEAGGNATCYEKEWAVIGRFAWVIPPIGGWVTLWRVDLQSGRRGPTPRCPDGASSWAMALHWRTHRDRNRGVRPHSQPVHEDGGGSVAGGAATAKIPVGPANPLNEMLPPDKARRSTTSSQRGRPDEGLDRGVIFARCQDTTAKLCGSFASPIAARRSTGTHALRCRRDAMVLVCIASPA